MIFKYIKISDILVCLDDLQSISFFFFFVDLQPNWNILHFIHFLYDLIFLNLCQGKLLRDVDPELMDALIRATKDCDQKKLQDLCGSEMLSIDDDEEEEEAQETDNEEEEVC